MMYWYGNGMNGWGYAVMAVSTIVFCALVIAGVAALARYLGRRSTGYGETSSRPAPGQLLAERFARGEISEAEYRQSLETLRQHHQV